MNRKSGEQARFYYTRNININDSKKILSGPTSNNLVSQLFVSLPYEYYERIQQRNITLACRNPGDFMIGVEQLWSKRNLLLLLRCLQQ
jgi:hypothetical protein